MLWLALASRLAACDKQQPASEVNRPSSATLDLPPFDAGRFQDRLDALRIAFESKLWHVSDSLLPGVAEAELRNRCAWFPSPLPAELVALYGWREGQAREPWDERYPFWFRDYGFSSIVRAEQEYRSMMASYGTNPQDHEFLKHSFPFAAFNGGWLVLPCKARHPNDPSQRSVVSVMQGVTVFFYSMELMVETCLDWVSNAAYAGNDHLPRAIELEIWKKHNPGIFGP